MSSEIEMCASCGRAFNVMYMVCVEVKPNQGVTLCQRCKELVYPDKEGVPCG